MVDCSSQWTPLDRILFEGPLLRIGAFRAHPRHPRFHDSGPIENYIFVFPRTAVWIQHQGQPAFVADPNIVAFYNRGQVYRRSRIDELGDWCEWFAVAPEIALEAVHRFESEAEEHAERPFSMSHGPSHPGAYVRQRRLVQDLVRSVNPDPLFVEETVLELLDAAVASAFHARRERVALPPGAARRHRDLAESAKALLAVGFRENGRVGDLAGALGVAPGHLCRVFRSQTAITLHQYRDQLRLRRALDWLGEPRADLTALALDLGYSSHSHFTERFHRAYGTTPSAFRARKAHTSITGRSGS